MHQEEGDLDMDAVRHFLREQQLKLENDKPTLTFKELKSDSDNSFDKINSNSGTFKINKSLATNSQSPPYSFNNEFKTKKMVTTRSITNIPLSPREEEKEKLINILSQSKPQHLGAKKVTNTARFSKINNYTVANDEREKEKDRLADIFASSNYQHSKPSNYEISKNLNSLLGVKGNENRLQMEPSSPATLTKKEARKPPDNTSLLDDEKLLRNKYNIPEISISEYNPDDFNHNAYMSNTGRSMVRMGEFSPNRNHPGRPPILGVGECDERRKMMLEQSRKDFQEYSRQQVEESHKSKLTTVAQENFNRNRQLQDVATQTEWENEPVRLCLKETQMTPRPWCQNLTPRRESASNFISPLRHTPTGSPAQLCFAGLSEKEVVKEQLYREDLKKQIEEKNRLKEELKKREEEEEAKMEAKIERDREKMRRQYEEERLQRLEIAIQKREQEEILRQRLAFEQEKSLQQSQEKKKQLMKKKSVSSKNVSPRKCSEHRVITFSQSLPSNCASKALADVHETLRQPLLEIQEPQLSTSPLPSSSTTVGTLNQLLTRSVSPPIHPKSSKDVDVLVRKTVFDPKLFRSESQQTENQTPPRNVTSVNEKLQEVDRLLREPLLPQSQSFQVLPPVSPPLIHATIPPAYPSRSPPVPATTRRSNADILNDKWKVPYDRRQNTTADDVLTRHNRSMLTQLGAFRRHLQQEKQRMQQRVADDSP